MLAGFALMSLGIFAILEAGRAITRVLAVIGVGVIIAGAVNILLFIRKLNVSKAEPASLGMGIIEVIAGVVILLNRFIADDIVPVIWAVATLYSAVIGFVNAAWLRKSGEKWITPFTHSVVRSVTSLTALFDPFSWGSTVIDIIIGLYMTCYGALWLYISAATLRDADRK
jgi:uncharacterized membrane protein HdeD (DUF308 family)